MRYLLNFLALCALFCNAARADENFSADKIYFFTHKGCPYCEMAERDIMPRSSVLNIETIDIDKPGGLYLFKKCVQKFKLGRAVGTPLFCMDNEYIMGWSDENRKRFDELSEHFKK